MQVWQAIVLGIVQGLTEFLPISSSGHLIIFPWLFDWETGGLSFDAALHLGTLAAVIVYFRKDLLDMIGAIPHALGNLMPLVRGEQTGNDRMDAHARLGIMIAIATVPGLVLGVLFESKIDKAFHADRASDRAILTIAIMLIVVGVVMWGAEQIGTRTRRIRNVAVIDAIIIGFAQALALIPGTSRSGATISAGLFRGFRREDAARFSFLAGAPIILGAGVKGLLDALQEGMTGHEVNLFLAGGISAAIVGFLTIWGLLRFLQRQSTLVFTIYRVVFGVFLLAMLAFR